LARSVGGGCRKEEGADWRGVLRAVPGRKGGRRTVLIGEKWGNRRKEGGKGRSARGLARRVGAVAGREEGEGANVRIGEESWGGYRKGARGRRECTDWRGVFRVVSGRKGARDVRREDWRGVQGNGIGSFFQRAGLQRTVLIGVQKRGRGTRIAGKPLAISDWSSERARGVQGDGREG
jgi:hypothetical protein